MNKIYKGGFIIFLIWVLHWSLIQVYSYICSPPGFYGLFQSFIMLGSPVCQFLNYLQYNLSTNFISIISAGAVTLLGLIK